MLSQFFPNPLTLRIVQSLVTLCLVLAAMGLAYRFRIAVVREGILSVVRGLIQVVAIGSLLLFVFRGPTWLSALVLGAMVLVASRMASQRAPHMPHAFAVACWSIVLGAITVLLAMTGAGVISYRSAAVIPIGSMLIANTMNNISLVLERLQSEIKNHTGHIETALALGATAEVAVAPYVQAAVKASLIPRIDTMRSLGIIWIPGMMTGMLLSGANPVEASLYQFVIVAMILAAGVIGAISCAVLSRAQWFTETGQLRRLES